MTLTWRAFPYLTKRALQKLLPNIKKSWLLSINKKHWVKRTLLYFNDWLKEKAQADNQMKQSATNAKLEDNSTSITKIKTASKLSASNSQKGNKEANAIFIHKYFRCILCKVKTGYGSFQFSGKRIQSRELRWWPIINFAFCEKQSINLNTIRPSDSTGQCKSTTSQQTSNKTKTMSSVTDGRDSFSWLNCIWSIQPV